MIESSTNNGPGSRGQGGELVIVPLGAIPLAADQSEVNDSEDFSWSIARKQEYRSGKTVSFNLF